MTYKKELMISASLLTMLVVGLSFLLGFAKVVDGAISFQVPTKTNSFEVTTLLSATTTSATSTNLSGGGGYVRIDGAKKVTWFLSRGDTTGTGNIGTTTFKIQTSPNGVTWYDYNQLTSSTSTQTAVGAGATSTIGNIPLASQPRIEAATTTLIFGMYLDNAAFFATRCVVIETIDGEHTCAISVEY